MKLKEQKELLAGLKEGEKFALKLYNSGVKIPGVVQKIRAAREEMESRIRFIEKQDRPAPKKPTIPVETKPAATQE